MRKTRDQGHSAPIPVLPYAAVSYSPQLSHSASISSMDMPYPLVGSETRTCVTAPTSLPFCIIGLPDIPCTIPPVSPISSSSVTLISIDLRSSELGYTFSITIEYSFTLPPAPERITAGPALISALEATGMGSECSPAISLSLPNIPALEFRIISPLSSLPSIEPPSWPGAPGFPGTTPDILAGWSFPES